MKTIKQIADELGVSKQAVFKKIDNLGLRKQLTKSNNQWLIDEKAENIIKKAFSPIKKVTSSSPTDSQLIDSLVVMLQKELEVKNKQIDELNSRLAESQRLLDQAQQLQAFAEQKVRLLEKKEEENGAEAEGRQPESEEKKSFFKRIFGA